MGDLSESAELVLSYVKSGRTSNLSAVRRKSGLTDQDLNAAVHELTDAGLIAVTGRRIYRPPSHGLSREAEILLAALPADSSPVGNLRLKTKLAWDPETYARAKRELVEARLARAGVGYGGTLARSDAELTEPETLARPTGRVGVGLVRREKELYEPFVEWLRDSFSDVQALFAHVKVTADERRRMGGKWSQPDVTAVRVSRHEWLPGVTVEVLTYEIKPVHDAGKLESVYEAAAHQRWAHWASLVIEQTSEAAEPADDVIEEVQRFGLGLYTMTRSKRGFDVRQLVEPTRVAPVPERTNELLAHFFRREDALRAQYRALIS